MAMEAAGTRDRCIELGQGGFGGEEKWVRVLDWGVDEDVGEEECAAKWGRRRCASCQLTKLAFQVGLVSLEYSEVLGDFCLIFFKIENILFFPNRGKWWVVKFWRKLSY